MGQDTPQNSDDEPSDLVSNSVSSLDSEGLSGSSSQIVRVSDSGITSETPETTGGLAAQTITPSTDGPARARRRRRWQSGFRPSTAILSTFSFVLMVAGVCGYAAGIPGLLVKSDTEGVTPMHALAFLDESARAAALQTADSTGALAGAPLAQTSDDLQNSVTSEALGLTDSSNPLAGVSSLVTSGGALNTKAASPSSTAGVADSFTKAVEASKEKEQEKNQTGNYFNLMLAGVKTS